MLIAPEGMCDKLVTFADIGRLLRTPAQSIGDSLSQYVCHANFNLNDRLAEGS
jgi:hypothetical protein